MAAGAAGLALVAYIVVTDATRERIDLLSDTGFQFLFHNGTSNIKDHYAKRFDGSPKEVDILGTRLDRLRADWHSEFGNWGDRSHVRILLMDPQFPPGSTTIATIRDEEESNVSGSISNQVGQFIKDSSDARTRGVAKSFEVRQYKAIPIVTIVRVDNELFWAPYLHGRRASSTPTMLVRTGGLLFGVLLEHFDSVWNDATTSRVT